MAEHSSAEKETSITFHPAAGGRVRVVKTPRGVSLTLADRYGGQSLDLTRMDAIELVRALRGLVPGVIEGAMESRP